jgi:hypothetical protein
LGGVTIPHPKGLDGHSDADVLMHAICDAVLGTLGERDIGGFFPNTDPRWKNAPSKVFLEEAARQPPLEDWLALLDSVRWRRLVFAPDGKLRFRKSYQRSTGALQRTSATELVEPIKTRQSAARTTRPS